MSALDEPKVLIQDLPMPKRSQHPVMPTAGEHELLEVRRDQVNRLSISAMLQSHFGGSPTELLLNLLDDERINAAELKELEELIRRHRKEKGSIRQA
jgi:hypothetical protein